MNENEVIETGQKTIDFKNRLKGATLANSEISGNEVTAQNNELFEFLWDKGYWAMKIGDETETHYIVVSAVTPKPFYPNGGAKESGIERTFTSENPDYKEKEQAYRLMLDILDKNILLNTPNIPLEEVLKRLREAGFNL